MSEISDQIRKVADEWDVTPLYKLADRIDSEMVELPRDRDGVPIHVGDTVYLDDGQKAEVISIVLAECASVINCWTYGRSFDYMPSGITHERPDSFERIAHELDEMVDASDSADDRYDRCERLADLAERIRKLAKKEG